MEERPKLISRTKLNLQGENNGENDYREDTFRSFRERRF